MIRAGGVYERKHPLRLDWFKAESVPRGPRGFATVEMEWVRLRRMGDAVGAKTVAVGMVSATGCLLTQRLWI